VSLSQSKWKRVSRAEPCPVCGKPDYCGRTVDGLAVRCMRVESENEVKDKNGGLGWYHVLKYPLPPAPPPKPIEKKADWTKEAKAMFDHEKAHDKRCELADALSVSVESLESLRVGIGWDEWSGAEYSSWPSRDNDGRVIGYVRRYADGSKRTNQGGSTGVFYSTEWFTRRGPLWVVEGGSDVAACESAGLCAIGRASNTHGGEYIRRMVKQCCPDKRVIVVGERDEVPNRRGVVSSCTLNCRGCNFCWPGLFGAKKVAAELSSAWVMIPSPNKDMRELLAAGGLWLDLMELF
jgi:hypothetical protein